MRMSRIWKLYLFFTIVLIISMTVAGFVLQILISKRLTTYLEKEALVLTQIIARILPDTENLSALDAFCRDYRNITGYRITLVKKDGNVIGESNRESAGMTDHSDRPEIMEALTGSMGTAIRFSDTLDMEMLYVASFLKEKNKVVRVAVPITEVKKIKNEVMFFLAIGLYMVPILSLVISFIFARHIASAST